MIDLLKEIVYHLVLLLLLATFLDMLLPKNTFTRHIRFVVGLFVMLTILQPLLQLFNWPGPVHFSIREPPEVETGKIIQTGMELQTATEIAALQAAKDRLEQQLEAMIYLNLGIDRVQAELTMENVPEQGPVVSRVTIYLQPGNDDGQEKALLVKEVEPVIVNTEHPPPVEVKADAELEKLKAKIMNGVSAYLGLDRDRIDILVGQSTDT